MANPTTNYGFVLPTSSDLVTDLPADFDVALQGVDTRLKALQPGTTLGDVTYASSTANTNTRLAIGSNGQVLTVASGVPSWANAAAAVIANGQSQVLTSQSTTSTTYTDLATVQSVTVTTGTRALVILSALVTTPSPADNTRCSMSFAVSGASTVSASDDYRFMWQGNNAFAFYDIAACNSFIITGLTAGSNTFTAKFKSNLGASATWEDRRIAVIDMGS